MTSDYRREHQGRVKGNDELLMLSSAGMAVINNAASFFEGIANEDDATDVLSGERLALKRAMVRFVIDSGIASTRGWV